MSALYEPCMVLNRNWELVAFWPVRTAIEALMRDQAAALDPTDENYQSLSFDEWMIHEPKDHEWIKTPSRQIAAPQMVVLKKYGERPPRKLTFTRPNLYRRDEHSCQYCGVKMAAERLTIEHVMPRSRGGPTSWENCVAACEDCNSRKADKTPKEAGMKLRKQPHRPSEKPKLPLPRRIRPSWMPFLKREGLVA